MTDGPDPDTPTPSPGRERALRGLHLLALSGFALAQPLFEVLGKAPTFFVVRGSQPVDLWILAGALVFAVPALLGLAEWLVGRLSPRLEAGLHLAFVAGLTALILAPLGKRAIDASEGH